MSSEDRLRRLLYS